MSVSRSVITYGKSVTMSVIRGFSGLQITTLSVSELPSNTKLLLTKNYSKIVIFGKLRISRVIPGKCLSFLDISRAHNDSKITTNNSQGIIFVIISCQRVTTVTDAVTDTD